MRRGDRAGAWLLRCALLMAAPAAAIVPATPGASTPALVAPTAQVSSANPLPWDDYSRALAHFEIRVTNNGALRDAFIVADIEKPPGMNGGVFGWVYSPTPTLPLDPGETGTFHVWFSGFEQAPPEGPGDGEYTATVHIRSTLDQSVATTVTASVRRSIPAQAATGTVTGRITGAGGGVIDGTAHLGDPDSVRAVDLSGPVNGGVYSITAPAGTYWLWIDAPGHRSGFADEVVVKAGKTTVADLALKANDVRAGVTQPTARGRPELPTYRGAFDADLTRIATLPGFYTRSNRRRAARAQEHLELFDGSGKQLWSAPLPDVSTLASDVGQWTSTDGGLDVSADGSLVALGTAGGTIEVFDVDSGKRLWRTAREDDVNPQVPGPLGRGVLRSSEVRFSPDGRSLAAGTLSGFVYLFDARTGNLAWSFATEGQVRALRFSPKGDKLYVGGGDNTLYVLKATNGGVMRRSDLLFWPWEHIGMDRKGRKIVTGGKDGVLRLFNKRGKQLWERQFPGFIMGYELSPDGKQVIVNSGATGVYGLTTKKGDLAWYRRDRMGSGRVFIDPTGAYVGYCLTSTGNGEAAIRVLQLDGTLVWEYRPQGGSTSIFNVAFLADGSRLAATGQSNGSSGEALVFDGWLRPARLRRPR